MFRMMAGAFGAHPGHDGHILGTLSAIQILAIQDSLHLVDTDRLVKCKHFIPRTLIRLVGQYAHLIALAPQSYFPS